MEIGTSADRRGSQCPGPCGRAHRLQGSARMNGRCPRTPDPRDSLVTARKPRPRLGLRQSAPALATGFDVSCDIQFPALGQAHALVVCAEKLQ